MDSMLGYVEMPYKNIGCIPAKLDDVFNYIPARLSGLVMLLAGGFEAEFQKRLEIFKRDRYNHASPNSAQTEPSAPVFWAFVWPGTPGITAFCTRKSTSATPCGRSPRRTFL